MVNPGPGVATTLHPLSQWSQAASVLGANLEQCAMCVKMLHSLIYKQANDSPDMVQLEVESTRLWMWHSVTMITPCSQHRTVLTRTLWLRIFAPQAA